MSDHSWKDKIDEMKQGKIDIEAANVELDILLDKYDWFYSSVIEGKSICVYVNIMDKEVMALVPEVFYGYHIKTGFASYLLSGEKYGKNPTSTDILNMLEEME